MGRAKEIVLKVIPASVTTPFVKRHHYSGKVVNNSNLHFGVFLDGRLHGVMSYGPGAHATSAEVARLALLAVRLAGGPALPRAHPLSEGDYAADLSPAGGWRGPTGEPSAPVRCAAMKRSGIALSLPQK